MTLAACVSMTQYDLMAKPIVTPEHNSVLPAQAQRSETVLRHLSISRLPMLVKVMMAWLTLVCIVMEFDFQQLFFHCTMIRRDDFRVWRTFRSLSGFGPSNDLEHLRRAQVLCLIKFAFIHLASAAPFLGLHTGRSVPLRAYSVSLIPHKLSDSAC